MSSLVVFGATSAIAQAYLNRVSKRYDSITVVARNEKHLAQVVAHLQVISRATVSSLLWDLADEKSHSELLQKIDSKMETVLICYGELGNQEKCIQDTEYARQQFRLNGTSVISLSAQVAKVLIRQQSGVLAVVGSVAGDRGRSSNYYYGAAKAAVDAFLSGLRADVLRAGVRVVTVKPGFVDTPMTRDFKKGLLWAKPEKVAIDMDRAISGHAEILYTPWFWRYVMLIIKCLPEKVFKRLSI